MYRKKSILIITISNMMLSLILFSSAVCAKPSIGEANELISHGWSSLRTGYSEESNGNVDTAIQAYQNASDCAAEALAIGDQLHFTYYEQPSGLHYLYGQSKLALAEAYISKHGDMDLIIEKLTAAQKAFQKTIRIIDLNYRYKGSEWARKRSDALFALGSVFLLQGKNEKARNCMLDIITHLDPNYEPALYAIESIDYMQGRRPQNITTQGIKLPDPPRENSPPSRLMEYIVEIGHMAFGRWGSVMGMLSEDLFIN